MNILVTGGSGFIGVHLIKELLAGGHSTANVDLKISPSHDLRVPANVDRLIRDADVCVHLAAKVGRLFGEDDLTETIVDNTAMTALVSRACGERGIRFVFASTSEVYGDNGEASCNEETGPYTLPHNLYGVSKLYAEDVARLYAPEELTILRFSMPYGPGLPAGKGRAALINVIYQAMHGQPIPIHRGAMRSWCWIGDTCRAARLVIEQSEGTYNVGRDDIPVLMLDVAKQVCKRLGAPRTLIEEVDAPGKQTVIKHLDTSKLRSLGWKPRVSLETGIELTTEWVRSLPAPTTG